MAKKLSFKNATQRASKILKDKRLSRKLIAKANSALHAKTTVSEKFESVKQLLRDYIRLLKSYGNGSYRDISWKSMVYVTAVLIYFITPTDLIPDFIPIGGLVDDASLAIWVYEHISTELENFLAWEHTKKSEIKNNG